MTRFEKKASELTIEVLRTLLSKVDDLCKRRWPKAFRHRHCEGVRYTKEMESL